MPEENKPQTPTRARGKGAPAPARKRVPGSGRKQRYTVDEVVAALRESRGLVAPAARSLGCDWGTVSRYAKRYAKVASVLEEARETLLDEAEGSLRTLVRAFDGESIRFLLRTVGRHRGYIDRREITGPGGNPVDIRVEFLPAPPPADPQE